MRLQETTLKDFGGGLNVSDSDKKLSPKYQTTSINVDRTTDNSFTPRNGYEFFADVYDGVETDEGDTALSLVTSSGGVITITHTAHGYASGDHITLSGIVADLGEHTIEQLNRTHGIHVIDADTYKIYIRTANTTIITSARTVGLVHDTHSLSGRTIFGRYFNNLLHIFAENGEIATVDATGAVTQLWNYTVAYGKSVEPWSHCKHVSAEIVRGSLICVNGRENDKPIDIITDNINYLVDAATTSNGAVVRADIVIAAGVYVLLVNTEYGVTKIEIGAKNTVGTFSRESDPADAVEIDVGMVTQTVDSYIYGAGFIRGKVFIGYYDKSVLMDIGVYNGAVHEPSFDDSVASFGAFSRAVIQELGSDLFSASINGVNSLALSKTTTNIIPQTLSELIDPALLAHINRLSLEDLQYKAFSTFDPVQNTYNLFLPKFTETTDTLLENPITVDDDFQALDYAYITWRNHPMALGDFVTVAGVVDSASGLLATSFNGVREIVGIADKNTIIIAVDPYPSNNNENFGGGAVTVTPVNDDTLTYVYETQPKLRIARWTVYKGLEFEWGTRSQFNRMFYGKNGKVYRMGNNTATVNADAVNDYDVRTWTVGTAYTVGQRVYDSTLGTSYECLVAHTSHGSGTFAEDRTRSNDNWQEFKGYAISWELETPWADFNLRAYNKEIQHIVFDTEGSAKFNMAVFTNNVSVDPLTRSLLPYRELVYSGQDAGLYGQGAGGYGGARNTGIESLIDFPVHGKLFKFRFSGASTNPLTISSVTMYYHKSQGLG